MATSGSEYTEHPGKDSNQGDIEQRKDIAQDIDAFNKEGWLKHIVKPTLDSVGSERTLYVKVL
jgi:hypothetical protein